MATRGLVASTPVAAPPASRARASARPEAAGICLPRLETFRTVRPNVACKANASDMAAAEKRWESQIKEGKVRNVTCKGAGDLLKEGWVVLDVRPSNEIKKGSIEGATEVPLFIPDKGLDPSSLLKQMSAFGMGGWWLGGMHMEPNPNFLAEVQSAVPKDAKVVIGCQKGLRSLAACEQLSRAGYQTLAWVNGGFDTAVPGDLPTKDGADLRLAGVGGVSAALGMTPQQAVSQPDEPTGGQQLLKVAATIVVLDLLVFGYEQIKYMMDN
ncbi:hypothetical protein BSKO_03943 [Bryopsis sp. KO-2023]|nr:hypothetical protein BSKO_03943 [Bryopsis sp. KO-2023]